jgi:hypothetical protein
MSDTVFQKKIIGIKSTYTPRVQTRPKPLDFSGVKILSMPSFGEEVTFTF